MESPKERLTAQTEAARVAEWGQKYLRGQTTISSLAMRSTLSTMPFWTQGLYVVQAPPFMSTQSPVSSASISSNTRKSEGLSSSVDMVEIKKFVPADPDRPTYQVQVWRKPDVWILSFNDNNEARWVNYGNPTNDLDKALEWATEASETYLRVQIIKSSVKKEVIHVGR